MDFQSIFTVSCAIGALVVAFIALLFVVVNSNAIKAVNNGFLSLRDSYGTLKNAFERVDQNQIKSMLTGLSEIEKDNLLTRQRLDLLDGKVTSFVNRESARQPRGKGSGEESDKEPKGKQADLMEQLKDLNLAKPLDNGNNEIPENAPTAIVRASAVK